VQIEELPADVRAELEDPEYITRSHYSRATYAEGCRGPLCRKAERDRGRRRNEHRATEAGREYEAKSDQRMEDDPLLDRIIDWHRSQIKVAAI
jgi:hypothetical protein